MTQLRAELEEAKAAFVGPVVCAYVCHSTSRWFSGFLSLHSYIQEEETAQAAFLREELRKKEMVNYSLTSFFYTFTFLLPLCSSPPSSFCPPSFILHIVYTSYVCTHVAPCRCQFNWRRLSRVWNSSCRRKNRLPLTTISLVSPHPHTLPTHTHSPLTTKQVTFVCALYRVPLHYTSIYAPLIVGLVYTI